MGKNLHIGDQAPDFTLPDKNNENISLHHYKGTWVILYFYPKDNTPGCTTEALEFTAALDTFRKYTTEILGISPDSCKSHASFYLKHKLEVTLLSDPDHQVLETYGVWQLKKNYGKEYYGVVRSTFLIDPAGIIRAQWLKVKVKGHVEEVLHTIKNLQSQI